MAGELLFRILDRRAAEALSFLDRGDWSLTRPAGKNYVVIDGSAFLEEAPWIYEGHDTFSEVQFASGETSTLLIPREVVADWRRRIEVPPANGDIARTASEVRDALTRLIAVTLEDDELALTVQSLL